MVKNRLFTDFFREVRRNKGRFISIFFIVLIGAAFFAGIRSAEYDMKYTADTFFDECRLMDFRVISTLGLTDDDIAEIRQTEGVELVVGAHGTEALTYIDEKEYAVRVLQVTDGVNEIYLEEGSLPESDTECVIDKEFAKNHGLTLGDEISLYGEETKIPDSLKESVYTVCGIGIYPSYIDLTRGSGSIGDGSINFWIALDQDAFDQDIYTEAYVRMEGGADRNSYDEGYQELADALEKRLSDLGDVSCHRRYQELTSELEEAKKKLSDGEQQLSDTRKQLEDGWALLEEGKNTLADKEKELEDGRAEYAQGLQKLSDGKIAYSEGLAQYTDGLNQYNAGLSQYYAGLEEYQNGLNAYNTHLAEYEAGLPAYQEALDQYEKGLEQYNAGLALYQAESAAAQSGERYYQILLSQITGLQTKVDNGTATPAEVDLLTSLQSAAEAYRRELDASAQELAAAKAELDEAKAQLDAFVPVKNQMESAKLALDGTKAQLDGAYQTLTVSKMQLDIVSEQLKQSKSRLDDAKAEIDSGEQELEAAKAALEEGDAALSDGKKELEEKEQELIRGQADYEQALPEAQQDIEDAKKQIEDGEKQLAELDIPEWYILGRNMISSVAGYGSDADRMESLGTVFPVMFFLVAALVSLTAMTRMIEEQRMQIGTLKALGYSNAVITCKYLGYALSAALIGSIIGSLIGGKALPFVIMFAYGILYVGLPYIKLPMDVAQTLLSILLSVFCITIATLAACGKQLRANPAQLMRPEPPKSGKRVWLERIQFLWKRLSFNRKTTIRNLFRYKKRLFMTIIGIGGCMALLLVGFGLQDSITQVAKKQFVEIFRNDASISLNTKDSDEDQAELLSEIARYDGIEDSLTLYMQSVALETKGHSKSAYLYVPADMEKVDEFLTLQDRVRAKTYAFPEQGAALSEKTAKDLGVSVGDTVLLKRGDEKAVQVEVSVIAENYVQHYMFLSPKVFADIYGQEPDYNLIHLRYQDHSELFEKELATYMMKQQACQGISFTSDLEKQIDDMLRSLNIVIVVLILSAGSLAFVVLYNLNNINITERRRELATLKVLGFYDREVAENVYRENVILTLLGVVSGLFFGTALHRFTIQTVEVEMMMFGRTISAGSYLIAALITIAFSVAVNAIMFFDLKKIDMIESLKSVE